MKRILSLVLAMVMVLGSFSAVFAVEPTVADEAVEILMDLGVLKEGKLDQELRRQDTIVLLSRLMGEEEDAKDFPSEDLTFTDVTDPFYKGYIAWAVENDITDGKSATKFGFGDSLKTQELAMFLLRVLGYGDVGFDKALEKAEELGLLTNVNDEKIIKRGDMAVMTLNALLTNPKGSDVTLAEELGFEVTEVVTALAIKEVKATKANELTVTFNQAVDTENVTLKVTRGTSAVTGKIVWNADKTVAVFTTDANMIKGTYTAEATLKVENADDVVVTGSTDVVGQYVKEIVILNDVALTGETAPNLRDKAYVYFDVLDQYGESVRNTTNIQWTSSVGGAGSLNDNRATGEITLTRTGQQFVYGEKIFISGVDTRTGVSVQKELTVGSPRALDSLNIKGFAVANSSKIVTELPAGFKADTYYMIFEALDQNGNVYSSNDVTNLDLTVVSDNPLLISIDPSAALKSFVIGGVEYKGILVQPGMNVDRGGEVNVMAIATKTGKQTVKNIKVGDFVILTQFDMLSPAGITAEDENIIIPFQAYDQHGNAITNFRVLARQASLNALTFSQPQGGTLRLSELADGTARLTLRQTHQGWGSSQTTDGIDRPVSLTSIVTGGNSSTLMLNISDKARPVAIKEVSMNKVLVSQGTTTVRLNDLDTTSGKSSFLFVDQYGREMSGTAYNSNNDTMLKQAYDFFVASESNAISGIDFAGYKYRIKAEYKGTDGHYAAPFATNDDKVYLRGIAGGDSFVLNATHTPNSVASGMALRFEIVRFVNATSTLESVSPVKTEPLTIINVRQVKSIEVKEIDKVHLPTSNTGNLTGEYIGTDVKTTDAVTNPITGDHITTVGVTGKYNNETVTIPTEYLLADAGKLNIDASNDIVGAKTPSSFKWREFYDITSPRLTRKDASDTVTVKVYDVTNFATTNAAIANVYTTTSRLVSISDEAPRLTTIDGADAWTINPTNTSFSGFDARFIATAGRYEYIDQYGVEIGVTLRYRISKVVENEEGYALNNFTYGGNDSAGLNIVGAERGDTFVVTIVATDSTGYTITKDVTVTVGADLNARIDNSTNVYLLNLIGKVDASNALVPGYLGLLEQQRVNTMK